MHSAFVRVATTLVLAVAGCAASPSPPSQTPDSQTQTTSATVPSRSGAASPSYGNSDMDTWGDPAATGVANHGSANPGDTSPPLPPRPPPPPRP
jgi:hypothetical protein